MNLWLYLKISCKLIAESCSNLKASSYWIVALPNSMENMYKRYGTSYIGYESNTKSGIKLQLVFDYLNQTLDQLNITEGIRSDQGYREHLSDVSSDDLLISDLGAKFF